MVLILIYLKHYFNLFETVREITYKIFQSIIDLFLILIQ